MNNKLFFDYNVDIKYKLDNGLTVLLKKVSNLPIISIQVWVKVGSLYEDDDTNGISHFLEHLVFKGTSKYSAEEISQLIESYGAILNAGTSKEYTVYYVDIPREGLEIAFDILFELVFSAKFIEDEVEKERSVVIEEIKRSEDQPINVLYDHFNQLLFTQTPYRRKIIGTEQNIRSLTRASIIEYYKKYYIPSNMIVSVCGDLNIEKVKSLINDKFSKINYTSRQILQLPLLKEEKKSKIFSVKKHKVQHTYFICGFLGPEIDSFYQYVGDISSIILGEGVSSRLNKVLKEEKKLVYEIGSGFYTQQGPSIFYISGVCDKKNLNKTIEIIDEIISNIRNVGVNKEEIEKAKNIILTRWYLNNESVHSIASNLAWWEMFRSIEELNNYIDNINKVTNEDIKSFFENYAKELIISALEPE